MNTHALVPALYWWMSSNRRGRPRGSVSTQPILISVMRSRCPMCDSSAVAWSASPSMLRARGTCPLNGRAYTAVRLTRKKCRQCGRVRLDRERVIEGG